MSRLARFHRADPSTALDELHNLIVEVLDEC
jgi:hypothetical protein